MDVLSEFISKHNIVTVGRCNDASRFQAWSKEGPLNNDKSIGCGINALTYLMVYDYAEGEKKALQVNRSEGTTFMEIMQEVSRKANIKIQEVLMDVSTMSNLQGLEQVLRQHLPNNSCTIVKWNRFAKEIRPASCRNFTPGHTQVLSKDSEGRLWIVDPQQGTRRQWIDSAMLFNKVVNKNCYKNVSLLFDLTQGNSIIESSIKPSSAATCPCCGRPLPK